jgi:Vacuolar sorting 38 and autophagy-related subunit 14
MAPTALTCEGCGSASPKNSTAPEEEEDDRVYCPSCVRRALHDAQERHAVAKQIWWNARQQCTEYFRNRPPHDDAAHRWMEYQHRQQALRMELDQLRQQCSKVAMEAYTLHAKIVERQEQQQRSPEPLATVRRQILSQIQRNLCGYYTAAPHDQDPTIVSESPANEIPPPSGGALIDAIQEAKQYNRTLRFHWAIQAFEMLRLHVEEEDLFNAAEKTLNHPASDPRQSVSGIGKISGLPLPHAGPELYGVLPREELQSALRLVAQLTHLVARCLGIVLPHPILLQPLSHPSTAESNPPVRTFILEKALLEEMDIANLARATNAPNTLSLERRGDGLYPTSTDSISSSTALSTLAQSMDPARVEQRIQHAVAPIVAEDVRRTTWYSLSTDPGVGLALLQNDILALCLRAGVPIPQLYPGEAILLNLYALKVYCREQVAVL